MSTSHGFPSCVPSRFFQSSFFFLISFFDSNSFILDFHSSFCYSLFSRFPYQPLYIPISYNFKHFIFSFSYHFSKSAITAKLLSRLTLYTFFFQFPSRFILFSSTSINSESYFMDMVIDINIFYLLVPLCISGFVFIQDS